MHGKDYRTLFLKEFVKELIRNSYKKREALPYHPTVQIQEVQQIMPQKSMRIASIPVEIFPQKIRIIPQLTAKPAQAQETSPIRPVPQPLPKGFSLPKIDYLIKDNSITSIECSGPNKPLLVKSFGRIYPVKEALSEEEIRKIVEMFSDYSRIPILEGIFKAAVGNMVVTSVLSDFVGSRFIINKYTPYSLIENAR